MASLGEAAAVRMTAAGAATRSTVAPVARNAWRYGAGPGALVLVGSLAFLRFGLSAAAAVAVVVFATIGWPPAGFGTEGSIGAAKRHQAQQLSAAVLRAHLVPRPRWRTR